MSSSPAGFMSYVGTDDDHDNGRISYLRERLQGEIRMQTGNDTFTIFQDRQDIAWGQQWEQRIDESLDAVTFLFPIITPGFFNSEACRKELERFLKREQELNRGDLILTIYYVDTPKINKEEKRRDDVLATTIAGRQYADWRNLRFEEQRSPAVAKMLANLAEQVVDALERPVTPTTSKDNHLDNMGRVENTPQFADHRLNKTIDFGTSLQEIATSFKARMDEFNTIDGGGPNKFLDLGAHVYCCCAHSLDKFLAKNTMTPENRYVVQEVSNRLKLLAKSSSDYLKHHPFPKYWIDGTKIADELIAHVEHSARFS